MKTITLTTEQLNTLNLGESITIEPPKPKLKFPLYAKSVDNGAIVKFDSLRNGLVVEASTHRGFCEFRKGEHRTDWLNLGQSATWTILPDYKETIEPAKPELKFPIYAKANCRSGLVVRFDSEKSGTVVEGDWGYTKGFFADYWASVANESSWTILPDYKETWEPKEVPVGSVYFSPLANGDTDFVENEGDNLDSAVRDSGAMCAEEWQAEEIARRNRINNLISQYVFEHLQEGEERNYCVEIPAPSQQFAFTVCSINQCQVLMPLRIAEMLVQDIKNGIVKLA